MPTSTIEVSGSALRHNVASLRQLHPAASVMAVVKANAYGHGIPQVIGAIDEVVDSYFVDDLDELRTARSLTAKPILVGGYVPRGDVEEAVSLDGTVVVYDRERLPALRAASTALGKPAKVHLKIDALLGRQGVLPSDLEAMGQELRAFPGIQLEGAYAHFANIEDTTDPAHAQAQVEVFNDAFERLAHLGWPKLLRHISSTSGTMVYEREARASDIVRLGIGLYGLYPSDALSRSFARLDLKPAMRWATKLAQTKTLPEGHPVGYGLTYLTSKRTYVGIVPQGYSDGYDRGLSNAAEVLVHGRRCPVIGRIAMNMFMVDLSSAPEAAPEDEVVLLGKQGDSRISAEELARRIGTINYEIVSRVSPLLHRVLVE